MQRYKKIARDCAGNDIEYLSDMTVTTVPDPCVVQLTKDCDSSGAPVPVPTLNCDGSTTDVNIKSGNATGVVILGQEKPFIFCTGKEFDKTVLCAPDGSKVIVVTTYDPVTGVPTSTAYNFDGTVYAGSITDLVYCGDSDTESDALIGCDGGVSVTQWVVEKDGVPTGAVYYTDATGAIVTPVAWTPGACASAQVLAQVPNCAGTLDDKPVDSIVGAYLLNQENKHTEVVYDVLTAVFGGSATFAYTVPFNVAISYAGVTLANDTLVQYWTDFGDGYNDVGPSPDHSYNSDGAYEIKGYAITTSGNKVLLFAKEVTITAGVITYSGVAGSQVVARTYTRLVAGAFQDYCGSLLVGAPYNADGTAYTLVGDFVASSPIVIDELEDNAEWNPENVADLVECVVGSANLVTEALDVNLGAIKEVVNPGSTLTTFHTLLGNNLDIQGDGLTNIMGAGINANISGSTYIGAQFTYTFNFISKDDPGDPADFGITVWDNVAGTSVTATSITSTATYAGDAQGSGLNVPFYGWGAPGTYTIVWTGDLPVGDYTIGYMNQNFSPADHVELQVTHNLVDSMTTSKAQLVALDQCTINALNPVVVAPVETPGGRIIINSASMSVIVGSDLVRSFSVKGLDNVKYNISFDSGTTWLTDIDGGDSWGEGNSDELDITGVFISPSVNGDRVFIHWETI